MYKTVVFLFSEWTERVTLNDKSNSFSDDFVLGNHYDAAFRRDFKMRFLIVGSIRGRAGRKIKFKSRNWVHSDSPAVGATGPDEDLEKLVLDLNEFWNTQAILHIYKLVHSFICLYIFNAPPPCHISSFSWSTRSSVGDYSCFQCIFVAHTTYMFIPWLFSDPIWLFHFFFNILKFYSLLESKYSFRMLPESRVPSLVSHLVSAV